MAAGGGRLALVLLHGRGHDPSSMHALAERAAPPDTLVIAPAAPGGSWYPQRFIEPRAANEPHLSAAIEAAHAALDEAAGAGVPPERTVLGGFSQGACLASDALARRPRPLAALAVICGGLIGTDDELASPEAGALAGLPVLLTGVEEDAWVPVERVRRTGEVLAAAGAEVDLHVEAPREHGVSEAEAEALRALLAGVAARHDPRHDDGGGA